MIRGIDERCGVRLWRWGVGVLWRTPGIHKWGRAKFIHNKQQNFIWRAKRHDQDDTPKPKTSKPSLTQAWLNEVVYLLGVLPYKIASHLNLRLYRTPPPPPPPPPPPSPPSSDVHQPRENGCCPRNRNRKEQGIHG